MIIGIKTDQPEACLVLSDQSGEVDREQWAAHRQLAETIHERLRQLLARHDKALPDVSALIVYKGPGSFTGLRIGMSVANALADGLRIPVVGVSGDAWFEQGLDRLQRHETDTLVLPEYGAPVHITPPRTN